MHSLHNGASKSLFSKEIVGDITQGEHTSLAMLFSIPASQLRDYGYASLISVAH